MLNLKMNLQDSLLSADGSMYCWDLSGKQYILKALKYINCHHIEI